MVFSWAGCHSRLVPVCAPGGTAARPTWHVAALRRAWARLSQKRFKVAVFESNLLQNL
jgi:hypothetical protein